jgi:uncharacterized repeat protein (TIGR03803 family)
MSIDNLYFHEASPLTPASNGLFYGISSANGLGDAGFIYSVNNAGLTIDILDFNTSAAPSTGIPIANLIQGPDGYLYGLTIAGGANNWGTFYKVALDGSNFTVLYNFDGATDGGAPENGLVMGSDGNFYGIGNSVFFSDLSPGAGHPYHPPTAAALQAIRSHQPPHPYNLRMPLTRMASAPAPSYSHPHPEGEGPNCSDYPASVFQQLTASGSMNEMYCESVPTGLFETTGPLVQTGEDTFVGMTSWSSSLSDSPGIFSITTNAPPTYLANTNGYGVPLGGPLAGPDGNFYSTFVLYDSESGCANDIYSGMLVSYPGDSYSFDYEETDCADANNMLGGLYLATDGNFYGAAPSDDNYGAGSIVQMTTDYDVNYPHLFTNGSGTNPITVPIQAADGNFYGRTQDQEVGYGPNMFYSLDTTPNLPAPIVLTASNTTPQASQPITMTWQVNNASALVAPVCVALIDNVPEPDAWSGIVTGSFSGNVYSGVTDVLAPPYPGTYEFQLVCNGYGSVQTQITVPYLYPTKTSISSTSPIAVGQTLTLSANVQVNYNNTTAGQSGNKVSSNFNNYPITGNITFSFNGSVLGTRRISNGQASIPMSTSTIPWGTYTIEADYSGDEYHHPSSTSSTVNLAGAPVNVSISTSVSILDIGSAITLNANVANSENDVAAPTGTVTFLADNNPIYTGTMTNGAISISPSTAAVLYGFHTYTAAYNGDTLHAATTSAGQVVSFLKNSTRTVMAVAANPIPSGSSETLTATVTSAYLVPTGNVCFFAGNTNLGCAPLVSGVATFTASTRGVKRGTYPVHAEYSSDLVHAISKSPVQQITISAAN